MAVVAVLKTLTSKDTLIMHLLRCLAFYAAHYGFEIESYHIPGMQNVAADAISRNNLTVIPSLIPQAAQQIIPQAILELLVLQIPDWGSPTWTHLFKLTLTMASPPPLEPSTILAGGNTSNSARQ